MILTIKNECTYHTLIELKFDVRYGVIFMAKLRLRTLKINNNSNKTVVEIHEEYMSYCKSIGQREGTLESKGLFYQFL